jgi:hypothetical protein
MQEHIDGRSDFMVSEFIDSGKNPGCLNENQRRYPRAFVNERFRGSNLLPVVARDKANQDVRVKRRACLFFI